MRYMRLASSASLSRTIAVMVAQPTQQRQMRIQSLLEIRPVADIVATPDGFGQSRQHPRQHHILDLLLAFPCVLSRRFPGRPAREPLHPLRVPGEWGRTSTCFVAC